MSFYSTQCDKPATNGTYEYYDFKNKELLILSHKSDPCVETSTPIGYVVSESVRVCVCVCV